MARSTNDLNAPGERLDEIMEADLDKCMKELNLDLDRKVQRNNQEFVLEPITKVIDRDLNAVAITGMVASLHNIGRKELRPSHGSGNKERKAAEAARNGRWNSSSASAGASVSSEEVRRPTRPMTDEELRAKGCSEAFVNNPNSKVKNITPEIKKLFYKGSARAALIDFHGASGQSKMEPEPMYKCHFCNENYTSPSLLASVYRRHYSEEERQKLRDRGVPDKEHPKYVWDFCSDSCNRNAVDTLCDKIQGKPFTNLSARQEHDICRSRMCAFCCESHHAGSHYFTIGIDQVTKQLLPYLEDYNTRKGKKWTPAELGAIHRDLFEQEKHEVRDEEGNVTEVHYNYFVLKLIPEK